MLAAITTHRRCPRSSLYRGFRAHLSVFFIQRSSRTKSQPATSTTASAPRNGWLNTLWCWRWVTKQPLAMFRWALGSSGKAGLSASWMRPSSFSADSPYLSAPSLTTVRILCLVVIARMLELKGAETSSLVSLVGSLVHTALALHIHRTSAVFSRMTPFEAEMRKRV